jgi:hypothetical protein
VGRPEGLCAEKGDPIPWVVQVEGKERVGGLEFVVGVEPGFWVVELWRVETKRANTSLWTHSLSSGVACC